MLYLLLSVGVFLIVCGGYLILREKRTRGMVFREVVKDQDRENGDWIRLLAANQELKEQMETVEKKLDGISDRLEQTGQQAKALAKPQAEVLSKPQAEVLSKPQAEVLPKPQAEVLPKPQAEVLSKPQAEVRFSPLKGFLAKPSGKEPSARRDYREAACRIADMRKQNMSVEDMASSLHMEKGEILFIQGLLEQKRKDL